MAPKLAEKGGSKQCTVSLPQCMNGASSIPGQYKHGHVAYFASCANRPAHLASVSCQESRECTRHRTTEVTNCRRSGKLTLEPRELVLKNGNDSYHKLLYSHGKVFEHCDIR